jgi:hypothetical protein
MIGYRQLQTSRAASRCPILDGLQQPTPEPVTPDTGLYPHAPHGRHQWVVFSEMTPGHSQPTRPVAGSSNAIEFCVHPVAADRLRPADRAGLVSLARMGRARKSGSERGGVIGRQPSTRPLRPRAHGLAANAEQRALSLAAACAPATASFSVQLLRLFTLDWTWLTTGVYRNPRRVKRFAAPAHSPRAA